ncbi:MAG: polyphosphate--nucleotide phosphotransferase [Sphingobacteriia bacterium 35-40-8]|nr:MAG: polyphosphate--nucleotide phosphotransferase [Sphingobacteriia bacterium 35-40-8]HQR94812.1 polyphosphate kinase 2 family protein [Sediminibacterium sp.]
MAKQKLINLDEYLVKPGKKIKLKSYSTSAKNKPLEKARGEELLARGIQELANLQDILYAHNEYSVLIVFQAMDAAGKDGTIKHLMSGLNPSGVKVSSFKTPSSTELDHDYIWRHYKELPARGEIGIFNRSHYENVLVTKVHPEYILNEKIPGITSVKDIKKAFWENRYAQIRRFEKNLAENGTIILKFFLNVSKDEQKKRFLDRIEDPKKNWKFSIADMNERAYWDQYQQAYEEMFNQTSTDYAPWYVIPADDKWYMRILVGLAIYEQFHKLKIDYPKVSDETKAALLKARDVLLAEK